MNDETLKEQIDTWIRQAYVNGSLDVNNPEPQGSDVCTELVWEAVLKDRERAVKEARLDELKQLWNNTQSEIVPEGVVAHDMSEALHKRMKKLNVIWYNVRFNFSYWLLGAKSMKVVRKNEKR